MRIDFKTKDFYTATSKVGSITIKKLPACDAVLAAELYAQFEMNSENYKPYIGLCEYDDFYGFGGKYEKLCADDFAEMARSEEYIILGAYTNASADQSASLGTGTDQNTNANQGTGTGGEPGVVLCGVTNATSASLGTGTDQNTNAEQGTGTGSEPGVVLCGVIWAQRRKAYFEDLDAFRMKPEYAGVPKLFARLRAENALVFGHAAVHRATPSFPSLLATMTYAMTDYCLSLGFAASVSELHKNISCEDSDGVHYLDTFDYNAYNAYKMLGFEHVGYMYPRDIEITPGIIITVEPQLIAGLDFETQKIVIGNILKKSEIAIS